MAQADFVALFAIPTSDVAPVLIAQLKLAMGVVVARLQVDASEARLLAVSAEGTAFVWDLHPNVVKHYVSGDLDPVQVRCDSIRIPAHAAQTTEECLALHADTCTLHACRVHDPSCAALLRCRLIPDRSLVGLKLEGSCLRGAGL